MVDALAQDAERIRGLRFLRAVAVTVEQAEAIRRYVASQIEEEELQRARETYVALGLLPEGLDVRALLIGLMGEQVLGYYDPKAGRLVIREGVMGDLEGGAGDAQATAARSVLVHELVHALQDQHLGLSAAVDLERTTDAENAFRALIEGDASLAMLGQPGTVGGGLRALTRDPATVRELARMVERENLQGSELADAPAIVREPLLSAYNEGLIFVADLHGGGGWAAVDRAHADPPTSTEQVLHPERYAQRDPPMQPSAPELPELLARGYRALPPDTLGELELSVYFGQALPRREARRAAAGWGGDSLRTYVRPGAPGAVVWALRWDDEDAAREAERAAAAVVEALPEAERPSALVARSGTSLLLTRGVPAMLHQRLRRSLDPAGGAH